MLGVACSGLNEQRTCDLSVLMILFFPNGALLNHSLVRFAAVADDDIVIVLASSSVPAASTPAAAAAAATFDANIPAAFSQSKL